MNTQPSSQGGLANNFWLQMTGMAVVVVIVIALAAKYIW